MVDHQWPVFISHTRTDTVAWVPADAGWQSGCVEDQPYENWRIR